MFDALTEKLLKPIRTFGRTGKITEKDLKDTLRGIRLALLEADVHFKVVKEFLHGVEQEALSQDLLKNISPGQQLIKIVHDSLVRFLGGSDEEISFDLKAVPPVSVLLVGLQGSGKTTSAAKLAGHLKKQKKSVLLVPLDNRRPAAKEQLQQMASKVGVPCFDSDLSKSPAKISKAAIKEAKKQVVDVVIFDTAGRLAIDTELMDEVSAIKKVVQPHASLFVADSMMGQDAVNVVQTFQEHIPLTGVILTKLDGDARGGAALSIKYLTGVPIQFVGMGESVDALELFSPKRLADRILDMGDVVSLVEKVQEVVSEEDAQASFEKATSGAFTLEDFLQQMKMMKKLGSVSGMLKMLPGGQQLSSRLKDANPEQELKQMEAIILSMTKRERRNHKILNGSRRVRIALGSGTHVSDVNRMVKKYTDTNRMLKQMTKSGLLKKFLGR